MNRLGDQFLAGAALAGDQHGRARGRDLRDQVEHGENPFALADDVREIVALLQGALELHVFFAQAPAFDGQRHLRQQLVVGPRLGDVVVRAALERRARHVDRAVGGDQHDRKAGIALVNFAQQFEAVAVGQADVEQQQIEGLLLQARQAASPVPTLSTE